MTTRVRPAASIAEIAEVAPAPTSMRRWLTPLRVSARSIAMRGGDSVVKICGDGDGRGELQRDLDLAAGQCRVGDVLEHVLGVRDAGDQESQQRKQPEQPVSYRRPGEPALRALSRFVIM